MREVYIYHSCRGLANCPTKRWGWRDKGLVTMSVRRSGKTVLRRYEKMVMTRTRMVREIMVVIVGDGKGISCSGDTGYGPNWG